MKTKITIDPELRKLIPPLQLGEREQLEANLKAEGCRDSLVVWPHNGKLILLDGHNRYEICERLGLPYGIEDVDLPDREAAADWIDTNQLGRRNLTPGQAALLRGRRYNRLKRKQGRPSKSPQNEDFKGKTAAQLAREHGVSRQTIERDGQLAEAVETLKSIVPDIEQRVMSRKGAPTKKTIMEAAKVAPHDPDEAALTIQGQPREKPNREPIKQANGVVRRRGRALDLAHEAIAVLKKIPRSDPFREDSMKIVIGYCKGVLNGVSQ